MNGRIILIVDFYILEKHAESGISTDLSVNGEHLGYHRPLNKSNYFISILNHFIFKISQTHCGFEILLSSLCFQS